MLISEITKKEVLDVNANKVGSITDVDLDVAKGTINYFILRLGTFKKVHVTSDKVDKMGAKIILNVSRADIEATPSTVK
ncbi:MAG: PRC-barrel domain-containing protein [Dehalococcoidales bacterium]|nr:PRC-barrel domain-containing protein [Dehalococcoidales bacterium]